MDAGNPSGSSGALRRWRDLPLKQKALLVLLIPTAALLVGVTVLYAMNRLEQQATKWVSHSLAVRGELAAILAEVVNAEDAVRGYVATGIDDFLQPYREAGDSVTARLARLDRLVKDSPVQMQQDGRLHSLVDRRLQLMARVVESASAEAPNRRERTVELLLQGKAAMDELRRHVGRMDSTEAELHAARERRVEELRTLSVATSAGGAALGMLGGVVAVLIFARGIIARVSVIEQNATRLAAGEPLLPMDDSRDEIGRVERALDAAYDLLESRTRALQEAQRELEVALHTNELVVRNSRDVICSIDGEGRFRSVSAAAEQVWGYTPEELKGRAYMDFVHPDDREKTMEAAASIMAGNSVTSFENCYVRKNGSYVDIMWSAQWSAAENLMFCVARDVTERVRVDRELKQARLEAERAREEAERANGAKSEFLSRMSHELRTPLNAILGFAQILEMEPRSKEDAESVDQILRGGRHLLGLINDILDLSRIEAGRLSISPEAVSVPEVLRQCAELMQPLTRTREITIVLPEEHGPAPYVRADRQRLTQVLLNLISNAVKYNRHGGTVTLSHRLRDQLLRIEVTDTGCGIRDSDTQRLFQPFDRLDRETDTTVEGTGLGLALSKRLVELMGGKIGFDSVPDVGSTFWIELLRERDPLKMTHALEAAQAQPGTASETRTVLYIEDNPSNLKLVERVLKTRPSVELLAATAGAAGIQLARQHVPHLILLDLNLPDMAGADVLAQLQNDPATARIPVIVVSADATKGQIRRLQEAGARAYIVKPLDVRKLLEAIEEQLQNGAGPRTSGSPAGA